MKVLVVGGGGREHALVWALKKSSAITELICAPGNGGIAELARCIPVQVNDLEKLLALVSHENPSLVVVGPEVPLALGLVDELRRRKVRVFGPTADAARLETSKAFGKEFMRQHRIPTAAYGVCRSLRDVERELPRFGPNVVVKADGLAQGKGVFVCRNHADAIAAAAQLFDGRVTGEPISKLVLEEALTGPEISFFAICDGVRAAYLGMAQDHKRIGEGDTGPNTGGMGAFCTDTLVSSEMANWLLQEVAQRVVDGMAEMQTPFVGVLFCGMMLTPAGPMVLEFNTRFGDPETQALLVRLDCDLLRVLEAAVDGRLDLVPIRRRPGVSACVIAASAGYPGMYQVGKPISGLPAPGDDGVIVFHSGTKVSDGEFVTAGGRVLGVTATGDTLPQAFERAYETMHQIHFEGMQYRRDIGWQVLKPKDRTR
jgi:phosphoribosylamine--glycine ligase